MLKGTIRYNDYLYTVQAIDTVDSYSMYIDSLNYESICFMCSNEPDNFGITEPHHLTPRRVDIKTTQVVVEYKKLVNDDGSKFVPLINADLFCRIAAILRWCKKECKITNQEGYDGLSFASDEIDLEASRNYIIKLPTDDSKTIAKITLTYGAITELDIDLGYFKMKLTDVEQSAEESIQFLKIKDKKSFGIAFNEDYLGFEIPKQEILTVSYDDGMYHSMQEIVDAHPDKEFSWLLKMNYKVVTDETLEQIIDYIYNFDGFVYFDTETSGLNINFLSRTGQADQCVGIILSVKYGESFFFPMQMKKIKNLCGGDHWYFMEHYVRKILEGKDIVAHNMTFDWKVAYIYDINANIIHDTMAMLELTLATEKEGYSTALKTNAKLILNRDSLELSDLLIDDSWGENDIRFWDLPEELVKYYACADTDNTMGLHQYAIQTGLLEKYGATKVYEIEVAFSLAVAYQEFYGHRLDINHMAEIREQIGKGLDETMAKMVAICGHEFNPNSPKQLLNVLYNELGIPEQISRKTGRPTTDKETLKKLSEITDEDDNVKYPFVQLLQQYREYEGVRKIADKFPEHMTKDGYIFSSVYQYGTTTGRVSIHEPNYQSYNDPIKKNIVPRPGYYMFDTDYSSVEYRVLGNMVGNKKIMESFEDPDFDYHQYQAARMYGIPYANVTKKMRKAAKGINFGLPYGMGDQSLGVRIFGEETEENTRKAAALRAAYFKGQEDIRDWFEQHRTKGVQLGYTETYFGRRRYYRKEKFTASAIRRQAGNQVIQGCLHGDTKIETKEFGIKSIKDLVGYSGFVWNGTGWTHGDVLYSGKKQKCIITFENGQKFICSPIHKFLKFGGDTTNIEDYIECKDLKSCHHVQCNMRSSLKVDAFDEFISPSVIEIEHEDENGDNVYELVEVDDRDRYLILKVESVEITDEYIDMYDVCNTDCGYYVADGIITHNTAADIYKTAAGRVFKRICKEGWLGKVLMVGFIHDELLGEVANDINPAHFLKVLREEFEVKVNNNDGSPWCPLYMGFGYGMSWYEAKSVELPIKYQWEIVDKYGETGFPEWNGDGRAFCDTIPDKLKEFEVRDIRNQLHDLNSQGKEIKPTLNNQVLDCIKDDADNYTKLIDDYIQESGDYAIIEAEKWEMPDYLKYAEKSLCEYLDKHAHIQSLYKDENGNFTNTFTPSKKTQEAIDQFCMLHATDRSLINLLDIAEVSESNLNMNISIEMGTDDGDDVADVVALRLEAQLRQWGSNIDYDNRKVILVYYGNIEVLSQLAQMGYFINRDSDSRGLDLFIRDSFGLYPPQNGEPAQKNTEYPTAYRVPEDKINLLRQFYMKNVPTWLDALKQKGIAV